MTIKHCKTTQFISVKQKKSQFFCVIQFPGLHYETVFLYLIFTSMTESIIHFGFLESYLTYIFNFNGDFKLLNSFTTKKTKTIYIDIDIKITQALSK